MQDLAAYRSDELTIHHLLQLSQSSRRQLSWDAERLAAAVALWHDQNARLGYGSHLAA